MPKATKSSSTTKSHPDAMAGEPAAYEQRRANVHAARTARAFGAGKQQGARGAPGRQRNRAAEEAGHPGAGRRVAIPGSKHGTSDAPGSEQPSPQQPAPAKK